MLKKMEKLINQSDFFSDASQERKVINVASVPQRSPFRYPGGKTWFVPELRRWLSGTKRPKLLLEPFAGGGIVGLTAAFENLVDQVLMVEKDPMVASVWKTILSDDNEWLASKILEFDLTVENCHSVLALNEVSVREEAFRTILRNRINHGGILAAGSGMLKHGEAGKGIASRWYPETLAKRIRAIGAVKNKITFIQDDGLDVIAAHKNQSNTALFIDPPYTAGTKGKRAGNRLYVHFELDHERLFDLAASHKGDYLMTYDDDCEVIDLAQSRGLKITRVPMKGTHHREVMELVIAPAWSKFS